MAFKEGLVIDPLLEPIQPASVDVRLDRHLIVPEGRRLLDPHKKIGPFDYARVFDQYLLYPGHFVLGATYEIIKIPRHLVGFLVGKSTIARLGIQVEAAGLVDPAWEGRLTFEIKNLGDDTIILRPGMTIGQIYFQTFAGYVMPEHVYGDAALNSHYQGATQVEGAQFQDADPPGSAALARVAQDPAE